MKRGDVYWASLAPAVGSEADKRRPCVIVSRDASNRVSPTVTIVPITSNLTTVYQFEVEVSDALGRPCKAQANQVRTISKSRLRGASIARLDASLMAEVEAALRLHLDL